MQSLRVILTLVSIMVALPASALDETSDRLVNDQRVFAESNAGKRMQRAKEFTTGCATSPFPTTPSGPQWTTTFNTSSAEAARLTVWRKPCSGNDAQLFLTFAPIAGSPFICSTRVDVVQNGVQLSSPFLNLSSTGVDSLCTDLLVPATAYIRPSSNSAPFNDDAAMTIFYESGSSSSGTVQIAVPAYDPAAYQVTPVDKSLQGGLSGTYFSASRSGEGVLVDFGQANGQPIVFFSWYTYGSGTQQWLVGSTAFSTSQTTVSLDVINTAGASFGALFRPEDVVRTPWGAVTLRFPNCTTMELSYRPLAGSPGTIVMTRGLDRLGQAQCN